MKNLALLGLTSLFLTSCSSWFLKRDCNKTNWFAHGELVAMSGRRLDEDNFLNQCRKVEAEVDEGSLDLGFKKGMAKYCQPETAFQTGRKGQFLSKNMCDGPGFKDLAARHQEGVRVYCQVDNAYLAGTKGDKYNYICPKDLEKSFLQEFNRGRRKYLSTEISIQQESVFRVEREIRQLRREKQDLNDKLSRLDAGARIAIRNGRQTVEINKGVSESEKSSAKWDIENDIRSVESQIRSKESQLEELHGKINELKREQTQL